MCVSMYINPRNPDIIIKHNNEREPNGEPHQQDRAEHSTQFNMKMMWLHRAGVSRLYKVSSEAVCK